MKNNYQQLTYAQKCHIEVPCTKKALAIENIRQVLQENVLIISRETIYLHIWADRKRVESFIHTFAVKAKVR